MKKPRLDDFRYGQRMLHTHRYWPLITRWKEAGLVRIEQAGRGVSVINLTKAGRAGADVERAERLETQRCVRRVK